MPKAWRAYVVAGHTQVLSEGALAATFPHLDPGGKGGIQVPQDCSKRQASLRPTWQGETAVYMTCIVNVQ